MDYPREQVLSPGVNAAILLKCGYIAHKTASRGFMRSTAYDGRFHATWENERWKLHFDRNNTPKHERWRHVPQIILRAMRVEADRLNQEENRHRETHRQLIQKQNAENLHRGSVRVRPSTTQVRVQNNWLEYLRGGIKSVARIAKGLAEKAHRPPSSEGSAS